MFECTSRPRWSPLAAVPIAAGIAWLWLASSFGVVGFAFSLIPGGLLLASGVSILLWPGDTRILSFTALGGLLGVPLALPAFLVTSPGGPLLLVALSAASYLAGGLAALRWEPHTPGAPVPEPTLGLVAQVAADEVVLSTLLSTLPMVAGEEWHRVRDEVIEAQALFDEHGWLEKPTTYHREPPPLEAAELVPARWLSREFEHLRFESGYEPHPDEPGRARWLSYGPNRTAHAWVVRHPGPPRPWLVLLHGFQLGSPPFDFRLFSPAFFADRLGLNLVYPVLPFHGERKVGRRSGDGLLTGDILDSVHAEAQAMWDIRRILGWVRAQGALRVGVHGVSLGGYQTALLAGLEGDLACAIAGIPLTDISRALWRHGPELLIRHGEHVGVQRDEVSEVLSVVSPLSLAPQVPHERRYVFGAAADRLVPADQVRDLWEHWERPRMLWYRGAHVTFLYDRQVRAFVKDALLESGLTASHPTRSDPARGVQTGR